MSERKRLTEKDIVHENGDFWVADEGDKYTVYKPYGLCWGMTASCTDSSYAKTEDGKSIAIARCDYLAKRKEQ